MLFLAAAALIMPAIFELVEGRGLPSPGAELVDYGGDVERLSVAVAIVLIATYVAGLVFSLRPTATCSTRHTRRRRNPRMERAALGDHARRRGRSRSA